MRDKDRLIRAFGNLNMHVTDGIVRESVSSGGSTVTVPSRHAVVLLCGSDISLTTAFEWKRQLGTDTSFAFEDTRKRWRTLCKL